MGSLEIVLVLGLLAILALAVAFARAMIQDIGWTLLIIRFFSGEHYSGNYKTNATWFHWANRENTRRYAHVTKYAHMPKALRLVIKLAVVASFIMLLYGLMMHRVLTVHSVEAALVAWAAYISLTIERSVLHRAHNRDVLYPLTVFLTEKLDMSAHGVRRSLRLKRNYLKSTEPYVGELRLPHHFDALESQQASINEYFRKSLPGKLELEWLLEGSPRKAIIRMAGDPPDTVMLEQPEVQKAMAACAPGDVILGLDKFRRPYKASFNGEDDPHWAFFVGTGYGKSTLLSMMAAQILKQDSDAKVMAIDPKIVSLQHLVGVKNFIYLHNPLDVQEMWDGIASFREMMDERMRIRKVEPEIEFPKAILMIDELNRFSDITRDHWRDINGRGQAPVWTDFRAILLQGREFSCHVVVVGQRLDDRSTGIQGTRDYFGFRGLAGYQPANWDMFIGKGTPFVPAQDRPGRWVFVRNGHTEWVQTTAGSIHSRYRNVMAIREWLDNGDIGTYNRASGQTEEDIIVGAPDASEHLGIAVRAFYNTRRRHPVPGEWKEHGKLHWTIPDLEAWHTQLSESR